MKRLLYIAALLVLPIVSFGQITNGLMHHWPLNGPSAGVWPDTIGGSDLSVTGTVAVVPGKLGNCVRFASGWLSCPSAPSMEANGASFTIAFWFRIADGASTGTMVAKSTSQYQVWQAEVLDYLTDIGEYLPDWQFGYTDALVSRRGVTAGGWHLWVSWFDAATGKITVKIDNRTTSSSVIQFFDVDPHAPLNVGVHNSTGWNQFMGDVDDLLYWNRALSGTEQSQLWNKGAGIVLP